ncbi:hypothetical protein GCM10010911_31360 [Paenibacillus nasutitermitis]|uniref:Cell envelope-related transcriptional attenuator domain-containing protein n=2 Tax=Paenibacillus nasutitermitis TaxID=1652958 RepID=A0A916Z0X1_9BACL|nr:hypothetical protein GCM10010911_31360 [Paenibacillus nasutitermitis]
MRRIMIVILLALVAVAGYLYWLYKDTLGSITTDAEPGIEVPAEESVKVKPVTFMLLGFDTREATGSLNTDVMMIASFNPTSKSATVVSIPRDSQINVDGYKIRKANGYYAAFLSSAKKEGLAQKEAEKKAKQGMRKMFGEFLGIPIDYTATINFKGFADVVDALGGVEVDVDIDMRYVDKADGTNINLSKGVQVLDGKKALDFVRYRKSNNGKNMSSDFERNQRQSLVLGEIADKMKSFSGVTRIGGVIKAVGNNMRMDVPSNEVENMMTTYFGIGRSDIEFIPLEGEWRSPYVHLNDAKLAEAKAALEAKLAE